MNQNKRQIADKLSEMPIEELEAMKNSLDKADVDTKHAEFFNELSYMIKDEINKRRN
mgnify:CR=1 FL=1